MADMSKEWKSALKSIGSQYAASASVPSVDIGTVLSELWWSVEAAIDTSSFPGGVKSAIKNGISVTTLSESDGVLSISAVKPSLIGAGSVDLARSYHEGWSVRNRNAYYRGEYKGKNVFIRFATTPGFSGHAGLQFLKIAADVVMSEYPGVIITVS